MLNFLAADAWSSDAMWAWYSARRALRDAADELESVAADLMPLVDASEWQSKGVRALHELIVELRTRTSAEASALTSAAHEFDRVGAS